MSHLIYIILISWTNHPKIGWNKHIAKNKKSVRQLRKIYYFRSIDIRTTWLNTTTGLNFRFHVHGCIHHFHLQYTCCSVFMHFRFHVSIYSTHSSFSRLKISRKTPRHLNNSEDATAAMHMPCLCPIFIITSYHLFIITSYHLISLHCNFPAPHFSESGEPSSWYVRREISLYVVMLECLIHSLFPCHCFWRVTQKEWPLCYVTEGCTPLCVQKEAALTS